VADAAACFWCSGRKNRGETEDFFGHRKPAAKPRRPWVRVPQPGPIRKGRLLPPFSDWYGQGIRTLKAAGRTISLCRPSFPEETEVF